MAHHPTLVESTGTRPKEVVALAIRDHQVNLDSWQYAALSKELHAWVDLFNLEFKLEFDSYPVIRFARIRNAYATYCYGRSEVGTRDNITFNTRELSRARFLVLRTLCHELLHLWQRYHGRSPRTNYHNAEYRDKARACGLIVTPQGCTSEHTDIFVEVLMKHGVQIDYQDGAVTPEVALYGAQKSELKMKKWSCGCTNVRCAVVLDAKCNGCKGKFVRST